MTRPECPRVPQPTEEHAISEEAIRAEEHFELELPDRSFLSGPRSRLHDFGTIFHVGMDFIRAFRTLHFVGPAVTVFGSARTQPGTTYYEMAREIGAEIAKLPTRAT